MATVTGTSGNDFIHVYGDGLTPPAGYNDEPDATDSADTIDSGNGGDDIIHAGGGDDIINFYGDLTNADEIDGGDGYDSLLVHDPTTVYFGASSLTNIEDIFLVTVPHPPTTPVYQNFTLGDANIAAGSDFTFDAEGQLAGTFVSFDYSTETDAHSVTVIGGAGNDTIKGRANPNNPSEDQIDFSQGGADFFLGDGDVYFGGALSADDRVMGHDRVRVAGDYSAGLTLTGTMLGDSGGYFVIGDGGPGFGPQGVGADNDYKFTATDDLIPAGGSWVFQVGSVDAGHSVYIDDSAETNALEVVMAGGPEDDTFIGGSGNDQFIIGGPRNGGGTDTVYGGAGDDVIEGGSTITAADHIDGGPGNDALSLDGDYSSGLTIDGVHIANIETITLGTDHEGSERIGNFKLTTTDAAVPAGGTLTIDAGGIESGTGALNFDGSAETNGSFILVASPGNDTLIGGAGNDTVSYAGVTGANGGVTVDLSNSNPQNTGPSGTDTLRSIENLTGSPFADNLTGNAGANVLDGGLGDDTLAGGAGNDTYFLRDVNRYTPVAQAQALDAGAFAPIGPIRAFYRYDTVIENPNAGTDTVKVAPVPGGTQYTLPANVENGQVIDTGAFALTGNGLDNFLLANGSGDRLDGGAGNDTLQGSTGADTLIGGTGNDVLVGGAGDDRFIFAPGDGMDSVADFAAGHGTDDKVDLTAYSNIRSFEAVLDHATQYGSDTTLKLGNGDAPTLLNVAVSQLDPDDFVLLKNPPHDFNADGMSDVLWQNDNGAVSIWEMNGTSLVSNPTLHVNPGPSWHAIDTGDFNNDGFADILWQNTNGAVSIWEMDGASVISNPTLSVNPGPSWHVIGTGDFNGDGKADLLWQNTNGAVSLWEMDGTSVISNPTLATNPGPSWHVIGTGDFNDDGKSDILWQNTNGAVSVWEMNGASVIANPTLKVNPGPSWHVIDAGDFNDDGFSDILWQNTNGAVSIWEMDGASVISNPTLTTNPGPSWHAVNAADYNGDGKSDITWQNDNGAASIWEMDGTTILHNPTLSPNPGSSWHVIGPEHGIST